MKFLNFLYIFIICCFIQTNLTYASNNTDKIHKFLSQKEYTIICFLSLSYCASCYEQKINIIDKSVLKKYNAQIVLVLSENLEEKEKAYLKKEYKADYIFSKDNNIFAGIYFPLDIPEMLILNNDGDILYKSNLKINFDSKFLGKNIFKLITRTKIYLGNNLLFSAQKIMLNKRNNKLYILDPMQNIIYAIEPETGKILNKVKITHDIDYYYFLKDSINMSWKKKWKNKSRIENFYFDNNNNLNVVYTVDKITHKIDFNKTDNKNDTSLFIYNKHLIAKYKSDTCFKIIPFPYNKFFHFDFSNIFYYNNRLYLYTFTNWDDFEQAMNEEPEKTFFISSFDSNFTNIRYEYKISDIPLENSKKYYSMFTPKISYNENHDFALFNDLNDILLTVNLQNHIVNRIKPFGTLALFFDYYSDLKPTPIKVFKDPNSIVFNYPYYVTDVFYYKDLIFLLFTHTINSEIDKVKIQIYNNKNVFINEKIINNFEKKNVVEIKFISISNNNIYFLVKYKNEGWRIEYLTI